MSSKILRRTCLWALLILSFGRAPSWAQGGGWLSASGRVKITPERLMWMSGYGARNHPAEGTLIDLYAKCLILKDPAGNPGVVITLDLVGIPRDMSQEICGALAERFHLSRKDIVLCCSHTHCGPVVGGNLMTMFDLDETQTQLVLEYADSLKKKIVQLVEETLGSLAPCQISCGTGNATFAVNRRNNTEANVPDLRAKGTLVGPVDYDVPVLAVRDKEGKVVSVLFGYACHATVMDFYQWSGDYPGFAQLELEKMYPGATALFFAGCGADQNPLPRRMPKYAEEYGQQLAQAVDRALRGVMKPVKGELKATYLEVPLNFAAIPTRESLLETAQSSNKYEAIRAKTLLAQLDKNGSINKTYPYPVQCWRLGDSAKWITLGGEVVVDYSLRIKRDLAGENTWVAGYSNDVMAYIPSLRVLKEGGYEGAGAMVYYGQPSPWAEDVEELIMQTVHAVSGN